MKVNSYFLLGYRNGSRNSFCKQDRVAGISKLDKEEENLHLCRKFAKVKDLI